MATAIQGDVRVEKDTMGEMQVPAQALYGASTQRAVLNFPISGRPVPASLVHAYGHRKGACAEVNRRLGLLDDGRAAAIVDAAGKVGAGEVDGHFPVDVFQTGSGTSTNMNANEVIANLVCVARGAAVGSSKNKDYLDAGGVHPNDHVNMGQSSNDTFPTALHIAGAQAIHDRLLPAAERLAASLEVKSRDFDDVIKIGRTHLQDATPIRLGQEFSGYAAQIRKGCERLRRALDALCELALGGTAVGTGINTHKAFGAQVAAHLAERLGIPFREATNHFEANHARDGAVEASGACKTLAVSLSKIANDHRLLGSGPRCGVGELRLPAVQPGSSIMPGKVNPVICEAVVMVACRVVGNDATVTTAGLGGVGGLLDLHVGMPVIGEALLDSIEILAGACETLRANCIEGLEADEQRCRELIEGSLAMCTSLAPVIGYDKAAAIAKQAFSEGRTVREVAYEVSGLDRERVDALLDPRSMTEPDAG
ncbi:MAG: class II fumarate hydratase [Phycisphaerales bacterium]